MWRLLGVRVGRRVFDDGCDIPERTLVTHRRRLHDQRPDLAAVPLAGGRHLQVRPRHRWATAAPIGVAAWTHYGVTLGDGAVLAADSFLMKGEEVPAGARWGGNPAGELRGLPAGPLPRSVSGHSDGNGRINGNGRPAALTNGHPAALTNGHPPGRHRADGEQAVADLAPVGRHAAAAAPRQS